MSLRFGKITNCLALLGRDQGGYLAGTTIPRRRFPSPFFHLLPDVRMYRSGVQ